MDNNVHPTRPGTYRELFKAALRVYLETATLTPQERHDAEHYAELLKNPDCKLLVETRHPGSSAPAGWGNAPFWTS